MPPLPLKKFHHKTQALIERLRATGKQPPAVCVACGGSGKSSRGGECVPCCGTGVEGEKNRRDLLL